MHAVAVVRGRVNVTQVQRSGWAQRLLAGISGAFYLSSVPELSLHALSLHLAYMRAQLAI